MELIIIKPEDRGKINPRALQTFDNEMSRLRRCGLDELTPEDFEEKELEEVAGRQQNIAAWLRGCGDGQPDYSPLDDIAGRIQATLDFFVLQNRVSRAYERKQKKLREESKRRDRQKQCGEAVERLRQEGYLNELTNADLKKYLSEDEKGEYNEAQNNLAKWVENGDYPFTFRAEFERISRLTEKVYNRKQAEQEELEEQQRKEEAERRAEQQRIEEQQRREESERRAEQAERERLKQVKAQFSRAEEEFKAKLSKDKLPLTYPLEQYHPDLWFNFEPPTDEEILTWLRPQANTLIPQQLREVVSWPTRLVTWRWLSKPGILIQAYYEKDGVPCLIFNFMVTILARVIFYFNAGTYNYSGFTLKLEEERLGEVITQRENYEPAGELSVPISLLLLLITDHLEAQGIEVTSICDNYTVYRVHGFKGEVPIHDDFRRFLRDICHENGLVKGLLAWGLIDNQVAEIVEAKMNEPGQLQSEEKPSPLTKKAMAFQLFSEGKGPSSAEVKALGMHKATRFKYYNQYVADYKA